MKKELRDVFTFAFSLVAFTATLTLFADWYDRRYPQEFPRYIVLGWPGPIIDMHIERPHPLPPPGGVGPNGNMG